MKNLTEKKIEKNLTKLYNSCKLSDIDAGIQWYKDARIFAYSVAKRHNFPFSKVCAVIAALSPRNRWERNKIDAEMLIDAALNGKPLPSPATYGAMTAKAIKIIKSKDSDAKTMLLILNGPKISNFFLNIYQNENQGVTVDTWIHLAAMGKYLKTEERPALGKKDYTKIETVIKNMSLNLNLKPYETQAILWVGFKKQTEERDYN